jgi:hypothetical protein
MTDELMGSAEPDEPETDVMGAPAEAAPGVMGDEEPDEEGTDLMGDAQAAGADGDTMGGPQPAEPDTDLMRPQRGD